jgi:mono/diheme cytochrome c family protein
LPVHRGRTLIAAPRSFNARNMKLSSPLPSLLLVVALSACASSGGTEPAPAPAGGASSMPAAQAETPAATAQPASAAAAIFSAAQADRGRDTFRASCTECHYSSEFSDSQFKFKWSRRHAGNLYQMIQTQMPETAPGSLSPEEAVDLVSYILRMNGFEPGTAELSSERTVLDRISLASIRNQ